MTFVPSSKTWRRSRWRAPAWTCAEVGYAWLPWPLSSPRGIGHVEDEGARDEVEDDCPLDVRRPAAGADRDHVQNGRPAAEGHRHGEGAVYGRGRRCGRRLEALIRVRRRDVDLVPGCSRAGDGD